jgi:transcriptional/translational regulatory protein YebC/TACO1
MAGHSKWANIQHRKGANALNVHSLLETLDDLDDVQNVHTNAEFPDSMSAAATAGAVATS